MTDFLLKDEGEFIAVKPQTERAKEWAHEHGYKNDLHAQFPDGFCGQPTWAPGHDGVYSFGIRPGAPYVFISLIESAGFSQQGDF